MKRKSILRSIYFVIFLIIFGLCLFAFIPTSTDKKLVGEIEDPSRYSEIRNQYQGITRHFPETIPSDAKDVKFHFHPSFMQGGMVIQLRMQLSANLIDELAHEYSQEAKFITYNGQVAKGGSEGGEIPQPQILVQEDTEDFIKECSTFFLYEEPLGEKKLVLESRDYLWSDNQPRETSSDLLGRRMVIRIYTDKN